MFLGSKVRLVRKVDNLTAIYEPISRQCGILNVSQPCRSPRPVTRITFTSTITLLEFYSAGAKFDSWPICASLMRFSKTQYF
jgi:hypothetical protein